ncbi:nucleolysin tiar [Hordeum vulgare]|nr:nucleolysin tiar [Hordeum vulgare]
MAANAVEAEAARNRTPPVPQLRTQAEQIKFLVSSIQGMEKNIQDILQNQKSLERVVETKFHDMDVKVTELNTIVKQLQHEVDSVKIPRSYDDVDDDDSDDDDEESPPRTTTQFSTKPRSAVVPASETRPISSAQASAPSAPPPASTQAPPVSTPLAPGHSAQEFTDALLSTPSSATQRDE